MNDRLRNVGASLRAALVDAFSSPEHDLKRSLDDLDLVLDQRLGTHRSLEQSLKTIGRDL